MLTTEDVKRLIAAAISDAEVEVSDLTGTSDHFQIRVIAPAFAGISRIEQHKLVHQALGEHLTREIHAVDIKTSAPKQ